MREGDVVPLPFLFSPTSLPFFSIQRGENNPFKDSSPFILIYFSSKD
jgi:hypothetical protein